MLLAYSALLGNAVADVTCGCSTYTVVSGDSIYGTIAPATGHNWLDICNCNGGSPACGALQVGQVLQMPCADGESPAATSPPTANPTANPTNAPTPKPTANPTNSPTANPTNSPTDATSASESASSDSDDPELPTLDDSGLTRDWFTTNQLGEGTYYGDWETNLAVTSSAVQAVGACGISGVDGLEAYGSDVMPIAISTVDYDGSLSCGMCIEYKGNGDGSGDDPISTTTWQKAIVVDACPGCASGDIDLAENGDGRWGVNWRAVECDVGTGNLEYTFYTGNHDWWVKMQVRNHKVPVYKVEMLDRMPETPNSKTYSGDYVDMIRTIDNHFLADSDNMTRPYSHKMKFRITSIYGEVVEEEIETLSNANLATLDFNNPVTGTVQFDDGSFGASASRRIVMTASKNMQHRIGELFAGL
jgi:hypothetical protein